MSFSGISLIACGDFNHFLLVMTGPSDMLYYPLNASNDSLESKVGRTIYEEFTTVVLLKQQMLVTDPVWFNFLWHLQVRDVQEHHLGMLWRLLVGSRGSGDAVDHKMAPWNTASLVTPQHAVWMQWNKEAS
ncbi:hypothetical protein DFH07DRAFT_775382 [Mycena maculata]|uniref:Uncharacterized protein n=1 Tax=Mycena maculata TaxID=230809 RepID=A0AAD7N8W3_9AGAR|nr:hypothetical protein DFH07DRAFT_775382 [Mycena maculata]